MSREGDCKGCGQHMKHLSGGYCNKLSCVALKTGKEPPTIQCKNCGKTIYKTSSSSGYCGDMLCQTAKHREYRRVLKEQKQVSPNDKKKVIRKVISAFKKNPWKQWAGRG